MGKGRQLTKQTTPTGPALAYLARPSIVRQTLQNMVLGSDGSLGLAEQTGPILVFPAWPAGWDVSFKLHARGSTVVEARCENNSITHFAVTPPSRAKDVRVMGCGGKLPPPHARDAAAAPRAGV